MLSSSRCLQLTPPVQNISSQSLPTRVCSVTNNSLTARKTSACVSLINIATLIAIALIISEPNASAICCAVGIFTSTLLTTYLIASPQTAKMNISFPSWAPPALARLCLSGSTFTQWESSAFEQTFEDAFNANLSRLASSSDPSDRNTARLGALYQRQAESDTLDPGISAAIAGAVAVRLPHISCPSPQFKNKGLRRWLGGRRGRYARPAAQESIYEISTANISLSRDIVDGAGKDGDTNLRRGPAIFAEREPSTRKSLLYLASSLEARLFVCEQDLQAASEARLATATATTSETSKATTNTSITTNSLDRVDSGVSFTTEKPERPSLGDDPDPQARRELLKSTLGERESVLDVNDMRFMYNHGTGAFWIDMPGKERVDCVREMVKREQREETEGEGVGCAIESDTEDEEEEVVVPKWTVTRVDRRKKQPVKGNGRRVTFAVGK